MFVFGWLQYDYRLNSKVKVYTTFRYIYVALTRMKRNKHMQTSVHNKLIILIFTGKLATALSRFDRFYNLASGATYSDRDLRAPLMTSGIGFDSQVIPL